jgi:hypothetical protein
MIVDGETVGEGRDGRDQTRHVERRQQREERTVKLGLRLNMQFPRARAHQVRVTFEDWRAVSAMTTASTG